MGAELDLFSFSHDRDDTFITAVIYKFQNLKIQSGGRMPHHTNRYNAVLF